MLFALALATAVPAAFAQDRPPERASGWTPKAPVVSKRDMVVAANPIAVDAGVRMLERGGSAVDAAIAVQLVLNLVEPQSSGIGGGAFMLFHNGKSGLVTAYDGRETAPAAAKPDRFLDAAGKPLAFHDAVVGGRSVGVPGVLRMLQLAHQQYGKLPWARLFEPAIAVAENGFAVSPRLAAAIAGEPYLRQERRQGLFFQSRRHAGRSRADAAQPGIRRHAQENRCGRRRCILQGRDRARHRRDGRSKYDQSRRHD